MQGWSGLGVLHECDLASEGEGEKLVHNVCSRTDGDLRLKEIVRCHVDMKEVGCQIHNKRGNLKAKQVRPVSPANVLAHAGMQRPDKSKAGVRNGIEFAECDGEKQNCLKDAGGYGVDGKAEDCTGECAVDKCVEAEALCWELASPGCGDSPKVQGAEAKCKAGHKDNGCVDRNSAGKLKHCCGGVGGVSFARKTVGQRGMRAKRRSSE